MPMLLTDLSVDGWSRPTIPLAPFERTKKEGLGEGELALSLKQNSHVVDRRERVLMIAPQIPLAPFESTTIVRLRFLELALICQQHAQVVDRPERVGVIAPESPLTALEIAAEEGLSFL